MKIYEIADANPQLTVAKKIAEECQPYLNQISPDTRLWRGFSKPVRITNSRIPCPVNRKPTSTNDVAHKITDNWFLKNMGIAYRSNAVFATGSYDVACQYGIPYVIFPIRAFKFCWSQQIKDMTFNLLDARVYGGDLELPPPDNEMDDYQRTIISALDAGGYKQDNLPAAISSGSEIMIHCAAYYAISQHDIDEVMEYLIDFGKTQ